MNIEYFNKYSSHTEENNTNNNVWTYTRVSSKLQYDKNGSVDTQKNSAKICADENGYTITEVFGGTYESAKGDFTRKEFKKLIDKVKKAKTDPLQ